MTNRRRQFLLLLALVGAGLGLALFRQRDLLRMLRYGRWLYPNERGLWRQLLRRFARAIWDGWRFARRCPDAHCDLAYGDHPRQRLDVFGPAGEMDRPVLIFFHGGGWESGTKDYYPSIARELTPRGIVVVLANYRLHPEFHYPVFMQDAAAVVRWAVDHIADYGGSPHKIFLSGHSAGAHIVTLLGLDEHFLAEQELGPAVIQGIVGMSGPYDLPTLASSLAGDLAADNPHSYIGAIMGGEANLEKASPVRHAHADAPPMLLIHGRTDRLVPPQQAELLASAQSGVGGSVQLHLLEGFNHFNIVLSLFGRLSEFSFSVADEIERFMRGRL